MEDETRMEPRRRVLLVTGGNGVLGSVLRPALRTSFALRVADRVASEQCGPDEALVGDLADPAFAARAVEGADAILHLAAYASPRATWAQVAPNIAITENVLAAATRHGVRHIVLASSNHAAGLNHRHGGHAVDPDEAAMPCCPYGAAKLAEESLGRLHATRSGATVVSLRFGLVGWTLEERDYAAMWLSDGDARVLVERALQAPNSGVHFGVSCDAARFWSVDSARAELGFAPADPLPPGTGDLPWVTDAPCLMFGAGSPVPPPHALSKPCPE